MADQWYYVQQGQRVGPVSMEALRQAVASGALYGADLVWTEGMEQWVPVTQVPDLAGAVRPMPLGYGVVGYAGGQVVYAGFWLRFVAAIIDAIITAVAGMIPGAIIGGAAAAMGVNPNSPAWIGVNLLIQAVSITIGWLYSALMESSRHQATLGKMALGLKVTDLEGGRITFGRATGRHFAKILSALILFVGYIMVAFTERKQGLHDMLASTLVVRKQP